MPRLRLRDLLVVAAPFLLLNAYLVFRPAPSAPAPVGPRLLTFRTGPWDATRDDGRGNPGVVRRLVFRFDRAMVDEARLGRTSRSREVTLDPTVDGALVWEDPATLLFEAESPFPPATTFTATLREDLTDRDGVRFRGGRERKFVTGALAVQAVTFLRFDHAGWPLVLATFNLPVAPGELAQHVTARAGGVSLSVTPTGTAIGRRQELRLDRPVRGELEIRIDSGLHAVNGARPLGGLHVFHVRAREALRPWFAEPRRESADRVGVEIRFNRSVEREDLARHLIVEPPVAFRLEGRRAVHRVVGPFRRGARYVLRLTPGLRSGPAALEREVRKVFHPPDRTPEVKIVTRGGRYLGGRGAKAVEIKSVNVAEAILVVDRVELPHVPHRISGVARWDELTTRVMTTRLALDGHLDEDTITRVDLAKLLGPGVRGIFRLTVRRPESWSYDRADVVVSDLGVGADLGARQATVHVASLASTAPVAGARVRLVDAGGLPVAAGVTGRDGTAVMPRSRWEPGREPAVLLAETGEDATYVHLADGRLRLGDEKAKGRPWLDGIAASVHPDRGIYRPGETVRVKAFVRSPGADVPPDIPVAVRLIRPDGRALPPIVARTGRDGSVAAELALPDWGPTGAWTVEVRVPDDRLLGRERIRVEEYLPDRMRVDLSAEDRRYSPGERIEVEVAARLLGGSPVSCAPARLRVTGRATDLRPAGWEGWSFGDPDEPDERILRLPARSELDVRGEATLGAKLPAAVGSRPYRIVASVSVEDPGGRAVTGSVERFLDPHPTYLGVREGEGAPAGVRRIEVCAIRPDGSPVELPEARLALDVVTWSSWWERRSDGSWRYVRDRSLARLAVRPVFLVGGRGTIDLRLPDRRDVVVRAEAAGAGAAALLVEADPDRPAERPAIVELMTDRPSYGPGDEVVVAVRSPHAGRLRWQLQDADVLLSGATALSGETGELRFVVPETDAPNLHLVATVLRPVEPGKTGLPRAHGVVSVPLRHEKLRLETRVPEEIRAGTELEVEIRATGPDGPLANADLAVFLVDEGILRLTSHRTRDPGEVFLGPRRPGTTRHDLYGRLLPSLAHAEDAPTGGDGGPKISEEALRLNPIQAHRVDPLVDWRPTVRTDADGIARVTFRPPDRLGEVRVSVVAAKGRLFGADEASVRLVRPLDVHAHLPRFLAPGDEVEAGIEVVSARDAAGEVRLHVEVDGPVEVREAPVVVRVEAGGRAVVPLRLAATHAGVVRIEVRAALGEVLARETTELSVRPAAPRTRQGATVGIRSGEETEVGAAGAWLQGTRRGEIVLSRSPLARLSGALDHLLRYPYGCLEQTTSTAFPLLYLRPLARATGKDLDERRLTALVQAGVDRVLSMRAPRGGLSLWPGGARPHRWGTCYAAHFLVEAQLAGYDVPADELDDLLSWLGREARHGGTGTMAYALYVRTLAGARDAQTTDRLAARAPDLPDWQRELLLAAGARTGLLTSLPAPTGRREEAPSPMGSRTRDLAIRLLARLDHAPASPEIPGLMEALFARQRNGRWWTTQENAFALLALGRACAVGSGGGTAVVGDEVVRLDGAAVVRLPDPGGPVRVRWDGPGVLWCSWHVDGVRTDGPPPEEDRGLAVRRRYRDLEGDEVNPEVLRRGDLVVVELQLKADRPTADLVLVDPLPACLEIENPAIRTRLGDDWVVQEGERGVTIQRYEARDDRFLLFASLPDEKPRTWRYLTRCVATGTFAVPPASLEAMYAPERRSVSRAGQVEVVR